MVSSSSCIIIISSSHHYCHHCHHHHHHLVIIIVDVSFWTNTKDCVQNSWMSQRWWAWVMMGRLPLAHHPNSPTHPFGSIWLIVLLVVRWDHKGGLTMRKLTAKQLFRSLLISVNTFLHTLDNLIVGTCSTSIHANLMFCCWPSFLWPFFLWTGNPSLHSRSRGHNSHEIAEDKSFHCMKVVNARQWPSSFYMMWTRYIPYVQCGTLFYAAWWAVNMAIMDRWFAVFGRHNGLSPVWK